MRHPSLLLLAPAALALAGCGVEPPVDSAALAGSWAEAPGIELLVSDGWSAPALPGVVRAETGVRVLVGTPDDPRIASLMERLPVEELSDERARAGRLVVEDMELL